jgi:hypothetical protein
MERFENDVGSAGNWLRCTGASTEQCPQGRYAHSGTLCGVFVLFFGGNAAQGAFMEDLLVWSVEKGKFLSPENGVLEKSGRGHHCAACFDSSLWVFGGKANGYKNDIHRFDYDKSVEKPGWKTISLAPHSKAVAKKCVLTY